MSNLRIYDVGICSPTRVQNPCGVKLNQSSSRKFLLNSLAFFIFHFSLSISYAQLVGFPVGPRTTHTHERNARTQALSLPFFDDFSLAKDGVVNPTLWASGGVYVSNTTTINHPTLGVVTFDGADAVGRPYNFATPSAQGSADTLASQVIDLAGLAPADSVQLSFYWQIRGLGEQPDPDDSLRVQFLDDKGAWLTVWKQAGGRQDNNFNFARISLRDRRYLHAGFRFRFQAFARQSGQFDTWHLDYVYLDKNRRTADRFVRDIACRLPISSFLKRYQAMPLKQYMIRPAAETADTITTDIQNLNNVFNSTTFSFTLKDELSGRVLQNVQQPSGQLIAALSSQVKNFRNTAITAIDTTVTKRLSLVSRFQILTTDNANPSIPSIDLRRNDSISGRTILDDYYAYDDGTPEYAVYMNRPLGRTSVRYFLNKPDVVSSVRMNVVPILRDLTGQSVTVQVWSNQNGRPNALLYQKSYRINYANSRGGFVEFPFDYGVAVKDTFYVGWLQVGQEGVAVGLDRNNQKQDQIFVNLGTEWVPYSSFQNDPNLAFFRGSLLIRPVMGGKALPPVTAVEPQKPAEWSIYPNPTSGVVSWERDDIKRVEVYSSGGVLLKYQTQQNAERSIDLSELSDGTYLLKLTNNEKTVVKKVMLRK
jgi:hypothetical protein